MVVCSDTNTDVFCVVTGQIRYVLLLQDSNVGIHSGRAHPGARLIS